MQGGFTGSGQDSPNLSKSEKGCFIVFGIIVILGIVSLVWFGR